MKDNPIFRIVQVKTRQDEFLDLPGLLIAYDSQDPLERHLLIPCQAGAYRIPNAESCVMTQEIEAKVYAVEVKGDTVWACGPDGVAYTIDSNFELFEARWKIFVVQ